MEKNQTITGEDFIKMVSDNVKTVGESLIEASKGQNEENQKMLLEVVDAMKSLVNTGFYQSIKDGARVTVDKYGVQSTEPGISLARWAKAATIADKDKKSVMDVVEDMYGHDKAFVESLKSVSVGGDGGNLVPSAFLAEMIPLLYSGTAVMELGARIIPMPNGNLSIPKLISGTSAQYIGENSKKNADNPRYATVKLSAKKLLAKVVISNDMLRSSDMSSDIYVRDDMVMQMQLKMDYTSLYGTGSDNMPKGIASTPGVNKETISEVPSSTNVVGPVRDVEGANSKLLRPGWIFNSTFKWLLYNITDGTGAFLFREELARGEFLGYPFRIVNQIPVGAGTGKPTDVFFGDWSEWLIGEQRRLEVGMSDVATYADEKGNDVSAFDNDQTVMKAMMIHDMAASHGEVFAKYSFYTVSA